MTDIYRIRIRGHLANHWSEWLDGLDIQHLEDGSTDLIGPIVDQAALHGVIARIRDLGLELLAIDRMAEPDGDTPDDAPDNGARGP